MEIFSVVAFLRSDLSFGSIALTLLFHPSEIQQDLILSIVTVTRSVIT